MSAARRLLVCLLPLALLRPAHPLPADSAAATTTTATSTTTTTSCVVGVDDFVKYVHTMHETHSVPHRHSRYGGLWLPLCEMRFEVVNGSREARCADSAAGGSCQDCVQLEVGGRAVACLRRPRREGVRKQPRLFQ